jgi:hypothetical protein
MGLDAIVVRPIGETGAGTLKTGVGTQVRDEFWMIIGDHHVSRSSLSLLLLLLINSHCNTNNNNV